MGERCFLGVVCGLRAIFLGGSGLFRFGWIFSARV